MIGGTGKVTQVLTFKRPLAGMVAVVGADQWTRAPSRFFFRNLLTFMASRSALTRTAGSQAPTNFLASEGSRVSATGHYSDMLAVW